MRASRETKVSSSLIRRLNLYALASGAAGVSLLALAQPCDAEVIVTGVHQTIGRNQEYFIRIGHGNPQFVIENTLGATTAQGSSFTFANQFMRPL